MTPTKIKLHSFIILYLEKKKEKKAISMDLNTLNGSLNFGATHQFLGD